MTGSLSADVERRWPLSCVTQLKKASTACGQAAICDSRLMRKCQGVAFINKIKQLPRNLTVWREANPADISAPLYSKLRRYVSLEKRSE